MSTEDGNFFSRWSRRKVQVRSGEPLSPEPAAPRPAAAVTPVAVVAPPAVQAPVPAEKPEEAPPALTLDDVARLTPESDFSSFVARGVSPEVRNAAVKKLFADPHFNVMDGLDIYIDDYSKPSPLSVADMAKMVGAQFLKLVEDPNDKQAPVAASLPGQTHHQPAEDSAETDTPAGEPADHPEDAPTEAPPLLASATDPSEPNNSQDDHADLQLQPDHAPGPQGPGRGAG
ncbi:hypothetical protein J2W49_002519 [Hydrogenophaga palleronii]|uniref:DUF3306 domain-containing protein n=1 Tax=Hydrogenophaga palleronii TaxID=65655 RepID=A0ABU1WMN4_9BURK|nr:DUF3306 domain-containing protein [Hydrogenophaga palleronii]MDR7150561.1 hypothetical protein [Hydrogenophaga palleronii]